MIETYVQDKQAWNDNKASITLLTPSGVVTVKFTKEYYAQYKKQLSELQDDGTKKVTVSNNTATITPQRDTSVSPEPKQNTTYTVKKGDCLWNIAKAIYGDGSKYTKIYEANKDKITNPNLIYVDQVFTIPPA